MNSYYLRYLPIRQAVRFVVTVAVAISFNGLKLKLIHLEKFVNILGIANNYIELINYVCKRYVEA